MGAEQGLYQLLAKQDGFFLPVLRMSAAASTVSFQFLCFDSLPTLGLLRIVGAFGLIGRPAFGFWLKYKDVVGGHVP